MSSQIQITGETKVKSLTGVLVGTSGVVSSLNIDGSLGIPQLDVNGKIIVSQLPNSVMEYKGTWDASTNTPTLANGTGNQGDVYLCSVAGTVNFGAGAIAFVVSDQVIYSGSIWQKASGTNGTVTSVGLSTNAGAITIGSSPITTSGTITANFNGTNLQYVNGAGNLTTFPILTGYVTAVSGTAPVVSSGGTTPAISMAAATGLVDGYLSATDFAIFNAKQSALTFSSPLVNTSGTISIPAATTSVNGYLASADFTTFNAKQNAITLTTTGTSGASTLVGATLNIPDYGSALTGYVTLATTQTITGAKTFSGYTTFTSTVDITSGLTFSNSGFTLVLQPPTLSVNRTVTLPNGTGTLALTSDISYPVSSVFGRTGAVVATNGDYTTAQVTESGNLYFTDSRARLALSFVAGSGAYNSTTGVITIPTNNNQITNGAGYTTNVGTVTSVAALTIGTSGTDLSSSVANSTTTPVITLNVPTASATNRGALSSADWTTFNNKQSALTNPVTGTGTNNYLPKFTSTGSTIGNSVIQESSNLIGIGMTPFSGYKLNVSGLQRNEGANTILNFGELDANNIYFQALNLVGNTSKGFVWYGTGEYMRIFSDGNVGINTGNTNAGYKLDVNGTGRFSAGGPTTSSIEIGSSDNATISSRESMIFQCNNTGAISGRTFVFRNGGKGYSDGTQLLEINSTGAATFSSSVTAQLGLCVSGQGGLSNSASKFNLDFYGGNSRFYSLGADASTKGGYEFHTNSSNGSLDVIALGIASTGAATFSSTITATQFNSLNSNASTPGFGVSSGNGMYNAGTNIVGFSTASTERMRITSGGALCLGVTSAYGTNLLNVNGGIYATSSVAAVVAADLDMMVFQNTGATYSKACLVASMTATGGTGSYFFYGQQSTSTAAIKIFSNGNIQNTNNSYGAISDARLKENIKDATPKLDDLMKVKVRNYNLKGESNKQLGVISQELEAIFPNMIEESTNMGENMKIKGVKYSVFVPMLIKAVQELKAEIEILKNK